LVQSFDGCVDFAVESVGIGEGLMGQMMRLEIVPDNLDIVELGRVLRQPLDGQPVLARIECRQGKLADVDRPIVLDQHDRLGRASRLGAVEAVDLLQMRNEVAAALGPARVNNEATRDAGSAPEPAVVEDAPARANRDDRPSR